MMKTLSQETRGTNSGYMAICYSDAPSLPCSGNQKENKYNALILMPGGDIGMIDVMLVLARGDEQWTRAVNISISFES